MNPAPPERPLDYDELSTPLDLDALFALPAGEAARRPLELEIGCGNGRYLRRAAAERPDHLFLGLERARKYARMAVARMQKYEVGNVRILSVDANRVLDGLIPPGRLAALHVYFTDPWPKKRHAKRRLVQPLFLERARRLLAPGAPLLIKVDLYWYFEEILARVEAAPGLRVTDNGQDARRQRDLVEITGFEQKALALRGRTFWLRAERQD